jgi:cullin-associated NEDD8-dissociated protein 1
LQAAQSFHDTLVDLALSELSYDPNLAQDVGMDTDSGGDDADYDEGFDLGEYDDDLNVDEDLSWKVRRAAAGLVVALLIAFPQLAGKMYELCHNTLVQRFAEREEMVKLDVLTAFCSLVQAAGRADPVHDAGALLGQLSTRSMPLKTAIFGALTMLVQDFGAEWAYGVSAVSAAATSLQDASSLNALKLEVLRFFQAMFVPDAVDHVGSSLAVVSGAISAALKDKHYIVVVAALNVVEGMAAMAAAGGSAEHFNVVMGFWNVVLEKLKQGDQDQQVKEAAIRCECYAATALPPVLFFKVGHHFNIDLMVALRGP